MGDERGQRAVEFFQVLLWSDKWTAACRERRNEFQEEKR